MGYFLYWISQSHFGKFGVLVVLSDICSTQQLAARLFKFESHKFETIEIYHFAKRNHGLLAEIRSLTESTTATLKSLFVKRTKDKLSAQNRDM